MKDLLIVKNCQYLLEMEKEQLKKTIFDPKEYNEDGELYSWNNYYKSLISYLHKVVKNGGNMLVDYKFAKNSSDGRKYANTFSVQSLQKDVKNFIILKEYTDFDQINAHFTLLSYICKKNNINCDTVDYYVRERTSILELNNITKQRVLVLLNQDVTKPKNLFETKLSNELKIIKLALLKIYSDISTTNTKNPISSKINKLICLYENEVLMLAVSKIHGETVSLCFDGFLTIDDTINVKMLDDLTSEYNIKWTTKEKVTKIIMPDNYIPSEITTSEYFEMKTIFEENNCLLLQPLAYLRNYDGNWNYYSQSDFKIIHNTMKKVADPFSQDGKSKKFLDIWMDDFKRLTYERLDFYPYNKLPCSMNNKLIKNTFQEFTRINNKFEKNTETDEFITNLKKLIFNLAEENTELSTFLTKWIAHMFQFPQHIPESVIVLKGNGGNGKDSLVELISKLLNNPKYICRSDKPQEIFGDFNSVLENKLLVAINEASGSDAVKYLENMKNIVTATTVNIQRKGKEIQTVNSYIRLMILSNNNKPICKNTDDRRYCVMTTSDNLKCDSSFFEPFYEGLQNENVLDVVFDYFNNMDLTGFKSNVFPDGIASKQLQQDSIKPIVSYLYDLCIDNPDGYFYNSKNEEELCISSTDFRKKFINYCKDEGHSFEFASSQKKIIMELNNFTNYITTNVQKKINGKNTKIIIFKYKLLLEYLRKNIYKNIDESLEIEEMDILPICLVDNSSDDDSLDQ